MTRILRKIENVIHNSVSNTWSSYYENLSYNRKSVGIAVVIGIFLFIKCDSVMGRFYCNSSLYYQKMLKHFRNCC